MWSSHRPRAYISFPTALLRRANMAEGEGVGVCAAGEHFALFSKLSVCYSGRLYDQLASGLTKI
jgi:hypothetical protein